MAAAGRRSWPQTASWPSRPGRRRRRARRRGAGTRSDARVHGGAPAAGRRRGCGRAFHDRQLETEDRIQVPILVWPVPAARRRIRQPDGRPAISAQRYNEPADYERLADALARRLGAPERRTDGPWRPTSADRRVDGRDLGRRRARPGPCSGAVDDPSRREPEPVEPPLFGAVGRVAAGVVPAASTARSYPPFGSVVVRRSGRPCARRGRGTRAGSRPTRRPPRRRRAETVRCRPWSQAGAAGGAAPARGLAWTRLGGRGGHRWRGAGSSRPEEHSNGVLLLDRCL